MIDNIDVFRITGSRLNHLNERQRVISENIANADTPRYRARDLRPFGFDSALLRATGPGRASSLSPTTTNASHMGGLRARHTEVAVGRPGYGEKPNGNSVVMEEQIVKQADTARAHDMATAVYRRSAALLRTATGGR